MFFAVKNSQNMLENKIIEDKAKNISAALQLFLRIYFLGEGCFVEGVITSSIMDMKEPVWWIQKISLKLFFLRLLQKPL